MRSGCDVTATNGSEVEHEIIDHDCVAHRHGCAAERLYRRPWARARRLVLLPPLSLLPLMNVLRFADRRWQALLIGICLLATLAGCACRPGYVGPYGGVRPARCWVW